MINLSKNQTAIHIWLRNRPKGAHTLCEMVFAKSTLCFWENVDHFRHVKILIETRLKIMFVIKCMEF